MPRIIFATGGTGGHIVPAIAVAKAVIEQRPDTEITFVGVGKEIEAKLIVTAGFSYSILPFVPLLGGGIVGRLRLLSSLPGGLIRAWKLFRDLKPDAVIGFGGYPSFLPMVTACLQRIPRILHEQNVQAGVANKFLARISDHVFAPLYSKGFSNRKKLTELPLPVREAIYSVTPWCAPREDEPLTMLVVGGSQGAKSLNSAIVEILPKLPLQNFRMIHQTGKLDFERIQGEYQKLPHLNADVRAFFDDIVPVLSAAHIVISRAGAMSAAELGVTGRPTIFVPLRIAAAHQYENARPYVEGGGALVVEHGDDFEQRLFAAVAELLGDPARVAEMSKAMRRISGVEGSEKPSHVIARALLHAAEARRS